MGRLLVGWPPSRLGTRLLAGRETRACRYVDVWNDHLVRAALDGDRALTFSPEARLVFETWHDDVEQELPAGRVYGDVKEFAVKISDSVARLAGLLTRLEFGDQVMPDHVQRPTPRCPRPKHPATAEQARSRSRRLRLAGVSIWRALTWLWRSSEK